jgi:two-component system OmpR family sensor kinase/two-component system sensor histidine kinase BaeS
MNRLWVRLSLMITGVLLFVFFVQFLAVLLPDADDQGPMPEGVAPEQRSDDTPPPAEVVRRLGNFAILSLVVGLVGGVVIARVVSAPISDLAKAARRIGQGDLDARVAARGSREQVELADTFNKMAADLQRAETLRNNLMADVSHELRTPLTVVEGNLRAALDDVYGLDAAEIANLYGQTRHLVRLVNDLRELALAENQQLPLVKQLTDVNALVAETLQALDPLAAEKGVILADRTDALPAVVVDPVRVRQVLFNLLFNALRHTPAGGEITVSGAQEAGALRLAVQDTGEGLEPDQLAAVFDRFYRADKARSRETGGSGLGLAIVKAIVAAHGGQVAAQSAGKGCGSTFVVTLPVG